MMPNYIKTKRRTFLFTLLISFFAISIVATGFLLMFLAQSNRLRMSDLKTAEKNTLQTVNYFITYKINRLTSDLEFVSNVLDDHLLDSSDYSDVASIWLDYSNSRTVYDQIRYLDTDGNEVIRINYDLHGAYIVPAIELQNKKDRYYFQNTIALDRGQVYISPLDLNVENNQIEQPINPMIRLGTPYFNAAGEKKGAVVLNYSAEDILQQVQSIASSTTGDISLVNSDGYWLYNESDPNKEWMFMFDPGSRVNFAEEYPQEWGAIQAGQSDSIQTKNGYFHFSRVFCSSILQSANSANAAMNQVGDWFIVASIPNTSPEWRYFNNSFGSLMLFILERYYVFYLVFLGISIITAVLSASNTTKKEQVKYYSEYDVMTSSYNRNAGIQRLNGLYRNLSKNNCVVSICFLDVNGLKEVNDVLGHEAGDELLITVANTIRQNIRSEDFLIRFGGDEFVIVFTSMGSNLAEQVWERVLAAFEAINQSEQRPYRISVSHGIQELLCGMNRMLDSILHQADEKMYEEKRRIKETLQVIRK